MQAWHGILVPKMQELQEIRWKNTGHFSQIQAEIFILQELQESVPRLQMLYRNKADSFDPSNNFLLPFNISDRSEFTTRGGVFDPRGRSKTNTPLKSSIEFEVQNSIPPLKFQSENETTPSKNSTLVVINFA